MVDNMNSEELAKELKKASTALASRHDADTSAYGGP